MSHLDLVMEQLLYLLITIIASSSIISAGNDTNFFISTTTLPNTTALSTQLDDSNTAARTSPEMSTTPASHHDFIKTIHTLKTVNTTTTPLFTSSHITSTTAVPAENRQSSSNGTSERQTNITSSPLTSSESFTEATQHTVSSLATTKVDVSGNISPTVQLYITKSEVTTPPVLLSGNSLTPLAFGVMSLILILIIVMVILVITINLRGQCRRTKQQEGIKNYDSVVSESNTTNNCEKESITLVSVRTINTDYDTDSPQVSSVRSTIVDHEDQEFNRDLLNIKGGL
ncbi:endothelial cell-specific chemotaxis regulator isoform X2 [Triplophysa dalaica]|uniref:endothelial cell-specific chemotaxis regulator isoform X2 n=1 Tax=Triplophysa dalaica TaxID=1582913 RepID=UPI0024DFC843|nr:endothelial cell-specific chemotaxis regulator isoform X2 [Triplophysa dalaica]